MAGSSFKAEFDTDGSGNWTITLPADCDKHDVLALGPVIDGMKAFLAPTLAQDRPIDLVPTELRVPPDLTA
jgi:hypothetical protein